MSTPERKTLKAPNRNLLWASIVVDELARSGLKAVCIAPGSRSTPLTLAFAQHPDITVYPHLDERSASFFALGIALKTDQPVALVCTSGTATANFFPAIIEAHESQVPLIILTGDRPPELRDSGANQTIDQVKLYGNYALWSVDMALPEADPDPLLIRYLRTTAARAYATANGLRKGVVHLNMPFRKPLEPTLVAGDKTDFPPPREDQKPYTSISQGVVHFSLSQMMTLTDIVKRYERGIIVCGPQAGETNFVESVIKLANATGYPVLADSLSGVRFDRRTAERVDRQFEHAQFLPENKRVRLSKPTIIGSYETFLNMTRVEPPDVIIRLGQVPTSKWLGEFLESTTPQHYVQISQNGVWADDLHLTTDFVQAGLLGLADGIDTMTSQRDDNEWLDQWRTLESATWEATEQSINSGDDFDAAFIYDLIEALPENAHLFVGNSLPIRHVDQFGKPSAKNIHVFGNRGASGIDGNISTALGIASQTGEPLVLLVGDITFYHDMNGLFAIRNLNLNNVTIVLMNNNGGGIFNRLPISGYDPAFTDLFIMPHNLQFEHAAKLYGMDWVSVTDRPTFRHTLSGALTSGVPQIVEVRTNIQQDEQRRKEVIQAVKRALQQRTQS